MKSMMVPCSSKFVILTLSLCAASRFQPGDRTRLYNLSRDLTQYTNDEVELVNRESRSRWNVRVVSAVRFSSHEGSELVFNESSLVPLNAAQSPRKKKVSVLEPLRIVRKSSVFLPNRRVQNQEITNKPPANMFSHCPFWPKSVFDLKEEGAGAKETSIFLGAKRHQKLSFPFSKKVHENHFVFASEIAGITALLTKYLQTEQSLGSGTSGEVKRFLSKRTGKEVAIKSCKPKSSEIQLSLLLNNSNIVKTYEVYETPQRAYFVMEYLQGSAVKANSPLPIRKAADIISQIASALEYMASHGKGIIWGDLKLENMRWADKDNTVLKICDFGSSKPLGAKQLASTDVCSAPEMHTDFPATCRKEYFTPKFDIWGLGSCLYQFLTGDIPNRCYWEGRTPEEFRLFLMKKLMYAQRNEFDRDICKTCPHCKQPQQDVKDICQTLPSRLCNLCKESIKADQWTGSASDLLKRMYTFDPVNRISASDVLKHPWIRKHGTCKSTGPSADVDDFKCQDPPSYSPKNQKPPVKAPSRPENVLEEYKIGDRVQIQSYRNMIREKRKQIGKQGEIKKTIDMKFEGICYVHGYEVMLDDGSSFRGPKEAVRLVKSESSVHSAPRPKVAVPSRRRSRSRSPARHQYFVGEKIEINYQQKGKWYEGTYKGADPKGRANHCGVEYKDTPGKILGIGVKGIRKINSEKNCNVKPQVAAPKKQRVQKSDWNCSACHRKGISEDVTLCPCGGWRCGVCTISNNAAREKCRMCDSDKK